MLPQVGLVLARSVMMLAMIASVACAPRGRPAAGPVAAVVTAPPRPLPTELGTGARSLRSGAVSREAVVRVLNDGPAMFLRVHDVAPVADGSTLIGWRLIRFFPAREASPLSDLDVVPGDVLLSVNGTFVERPEHLMSVWQGLYTAPEIRAVIARDRERIELHYRILDVAPAGPGQTPEAPTPVSTTPAATSLPPARSQP